MARTRGTGIGKGTWIAGGALVAVLALTGYVALSGDHEGTDTAGKGGASASRSRSASPAPSYSVPEDWTEPDRWAALPRGKRTDEHGSPVGFPHTTEGAVAMMAAANTVSIEADRSSIDEQLRLYRSYVAASDQSSETAEVVELRARETDKELHKSMGVAAGQPLPPGAYVHNTVIGYQVIKESADEVSVWLLTRVVQKAGETAKESGSYTRSLSGAEWMDGDWKLSGRAAGKVQQEARANKPQMAAPGDEAFNRSEWTAIREKA